MDVEDLKTACRRFEKEHGVEAFLDATAKLMTERMAVQGLELRFFDDGVESDLQHSSTDEPNSSKPEKWV
ncbi:hypothetical protein JNB91_29075 [Rhizobium wenxiniae]|uniref:hypothetical protein n=1 Tax=Rhizobium wenxiniae TaxID=1737357 RepID=UPI001C6E1425|nr:hypothetical protein [Rhizobium wenxiniae]MBW9091835.1 hypothetical protein [Rhizobium wenxiniae]